MKRMVLALICTALLITALGCTDDHQATPDDARSSSVPALPLDDVTMVAINVLHGLFCPEETDGCQAGDRLTLLWRAIAEAGCPDLVGLSEIGPRQGQLVPERLAELCDGQYQLVWDPVAQGQEFDRQMILSALPVLEESYVDLAAFPWGAHWAKVQTDTGVVDFVTTHFASSSNNPPCAPDFCPPICEMGVETGTCHAVQIVDFLQQRGTSDGTWVISGDLNREISDTRLQPIGSAGYLDVWSLARVAECDPATGNGCTCCIGSPTEDYDGGGLRDETRRRDSRIDFIFVRANRDGCEAAVDTVDDTDADGTVTGPFAADPTPAPVNGVFWPSDHSGVQADVSVVCS